MINMGGVIIDGHSETGSVPGKITFSENKQEPGKRFDKDKARYDLLPTDSIHELVMVYTKGAEKYSERNWEKGMSWSRCFGPMMRHAWKWWAGEKVDQETGLHHLAHVAWNALALVSYEMREIGTDDRVILQKNDKYKNNNNGVSDQNLNNDKSILDTSPRT